jgi:hypothetical protein
MQTPAAFKPKNKPVKVKTGGPGPIQSVIMIGGTAMAVALFGGTYAAFSRMTAHLKPVAAPKTGAEAAGGLKQMRSGPGGATANPYAEDPDDPDSEMEIE